MRLLSIDSSAKSASCAIMHDFALEGEFFINGGFTHSETLMPMVEALYKTLSLSNSDIDLFAVNVGPGSFTGVRIGVSAVKGMAFATGKPCVGVSSLLSLAYNISGFDGIICPVMDARRSQFYNALFYQDGDERVRLCPDRAIGGEELLGELKALKKPVILVGDGALLCYNSFEIIEGISLAHEDIRLSRASSVARAALWAYSRAEQTDSRGLSPFYLRPSQAERERAAREKGELQSQNG